MKSRAWLRSLILMGYLSVVASAEGRITPLFDIDQCAAKAKSIVVGTLHQDGTLAGQAAIKGELVASKRYKLEPGRLPMRRQEAISGEKVEVVAFLGEGREDGIYPVAAPAGVIAFDPDGKVYGWFPALTVTGGAFQAHESWTRDEFLRRVDDALKKSVELEALLAEPRSGQRIEKLFAFMRAHVPWPKEERTDRLIFWRDRHGYLFSEITQGLQQPSEEEEAFLRRQLQGKPADEDAARTLALIRGMSCSKALYETVRAFAEAECAVFVRRRAFLAMTSIDPYAGAGDLTRFLKVGDPALDDVIHAVGWCGQGRAPIVFNPAVIPPLREFALGVRKQLRENVYHGNLENFTHWLMQNYFHPELLPVMREWADDPAPSTAGPAESSLRQVLGLSHEPEDPAGLRQWWSENEAMIQREFDLDTEDGVKEWLAACGRTNDAKTRKVLLRWWDFQAEVPEPVLLEACKGPAPEPAKRLLAELWQRGRLSFEAQKKIVGEYLKMQIVELPNPHPHLPKWREIRVSGDLQFPFPEGAWIEVIGDLACGREPDISKRTSGSSFSLGSGRRDLYSVGGSVDGGAKAVIELRGEDHLRRSFEKTWRLRWELDQRIKGPVPPISE